MRAWLKRVLQVRDTPEAQARGLAVGFFFGVSPLPGLQIVLAVAASHLLRGNKVLAGAMTAISNPFTSLPLYGASLMLGRAILGSGEPMPDLASLRTMSDVLALGPGFAAQLAVGTLLVGSVGSVGVYFGAGRLLRLFGRWAETRTVAELSAQKAP